MLQGHALLLSLLVEVSISQLVRRSDPLQRSRRQIPGGVDFAGCQTEPETGLCCVDKEETVTSLEKEPILECTHKNVEQCHYTYVTQFKPSQEEVGLIFKLQPFVQSGCEIADTRF